MILNDKNVNTVDVINVKGKKMRVGEFAQLHWKKWQANGELIFQEKINVYTKKTVSIIMSVYNEENTVQKVLAELKKIEYINEIIVVDNGSEDQSNQLIKIQ